MRSWESDKAATSSSSCEKIAFTGLGLVADTWACIRVKLYSNFGDQVAFGLIYNYFIWLDLEQSSEVVMRAVIFDISHQRPQFRIRNQLDSIKTFRGILLTSL